MKMECRTRWCALLLWLAAAAVQASGGVADIREQVEASMLVTGRVTITLEGTVGDWTIDRREKLPPAVAKVVDAAAPGWRFEPIVVDGKPAHGSARMSLLIVAERVGEGRFRASIRDGYFGREAANRLGERRAGKTEVPDPEQLTSVWMRPPLYPQRALLAGISGTVYLALRVGRGGEVEEAAVEQVNLRAVGTEREMAFARDILAGAALAASRKWQFRPPTLGKSASDASWTVRVPVDYSINGDRQAAYGQWETYVAGPRTPVPWELESPEALAVAPETLVAGELHQSGMALKLLGPLEGG